MIELNSELELSNQTKGSAQKIIEYTEIYRQLNPHFITLRKLSDNLIALEGIGNELQFSEELLHVLSVIRTSFVEFNEIWLENSEAVRQGNSLINLVNGLKGVSDKFEKELKEYWDLQIESLKNSFALEDVLLETQKLIPGKEVIYSEYIINRTSFNEKSKNLPEESSVINEIQTIAKKLQELIVQMEFNLPEEVEVFFKHLRLPINGGKAPLRLLTKNVIDWIEVNKLTDKFFVEQMNRRF
ncbi:hypothetical protein [Flavobacterium sp.]|uniref:hypothetical protein n=1 Tax=Flavobacterium sp. TaxID=239 RepID=UPI0026219B50|nr:hypothetical protein [Flavobacterium sp.]